MSIIIRDVPIMTKRQIRAIKAAHPIVEDITKSPSKFFLPSFIIQRYMKIHKSLNIFKIKKPNLAKVGFLIKVEIDLIKIAVSTPSISNSDYPKSAYLGLSTPGFVCDVLGVLTSDPTGDRFNNPQHLLNVAPCFIHISRYGLIWTCV